MVYGSKLTGKKIIFGAVTTFLPKVYKTSVRLMTNNLILIIQNWENKIIIGFKKNNKNNLEEYKI